MNKFDRFKKSDLKKAVKNSTSFRGVCRYLGLEHSPRVKSRIKKDGIDYSHFPFGKGYSGSIGKKVKKLTIKKIFKEENNRWYCDCLCDCGETTKRKRLDGVLNGRIVSCGCAYKNRTSQGIRLKNRPVNLSWVYPLNRLLKNTITW